MGEVIVNPYNVLVVDDEEVVREVGCRMLERLGHRPYAVADARNALEIYKRAPEDGKFDLAIVDLRMPGMNGKELRAGLRRIDGEAAIKPIPVILMTGTLFDLTPEEIKEFTYHLKKPFSLDEMRTAIYEAFKKPDQPDPNPTVINT